ncbi:MAG: winged helix-turn-helix domain-containing protein [Candidatus Bathyarchaeia archaeon]|jgi:predicted transcriptional regulator
MRRNNLDICADILQVAQPGARKTQIVYKANLNFMIVKKYLRNLIENGFIEKFDKLYYTTNKGVNFIESYEEFSSVAGGVR